MNAPWQHHGPPIRTVCDDCGGLIYHLIGGTKVCVDCDRLVDWPRFHKSGLYDQDGGDR